MITVQWEGTLTCMCGAVVEGATASSTGGAQSAVQQGSLWLEKSEEAMAAGDRRLDSSDLMHDYCRGYPSPSR